MFTASWASLTAIPGRGQLVQFRLPVKPALYLIGRINEAPRELLPLASRRRRAKESDSEEEVQGVARFRTYGLSNSPGSITGCSSCSPLNSLHGLVQEDCGLMRVGEPFLCSACFGQCRFDLPRTQLAQLNGVGSRCDWSNPNQKPRGPDPPEPAPDHRHQPGRWSSRPQRSPRRGFVLPLPRL